jgi:1,2-diacylglycerol 3-beta-galactosyltransferase
MDDSPRVLILTADAGFGHRSAANAVAVAVRELNSAAKLDIVNALDHPLTPRAFRDGQSDYDRIVRESPDLWQATYEATDTTLASKLMESALVAALYAPLRDILNEYDPDVIVSTYMLYQAPLNAIFRLNGKRVPLITVITDLISVHRIWFSNAPDTLIVPTEPVRQLALDAGVREDKLRVIGIPVNPALGVDIGPGGKAELRARLSWRADLTTVLAIGSKRVPRLAEMLRGLNHAGLPIQLVVSAGGDDELHAQLSNIEWHVPIVIYRFVDQMPTFMHAADVLMCKAGGLITTEALACGLPLLLIDVIPGQEEGNAQYVLEGGAGVKADDPLDVLEYTFHWLKDDAVTLKQTAERARKLGKPQAAREVADLALRDAEFAARWREQSPTQGGVLTLEELRRVIERISTLGARSSQRKYL